MDLYIMRHGETAWNKAGKIQGSSDIPLTDFGRELAKLSGEGFYRDGIVFDRIYTSPLLRAVETAEIIGKKTTSADTFPAEIRVDERLREMSFGKYEGRVLREIRERDKNIFLCFTAPSEYIPDPTGESYDHLYVRIRSFLEDTLRPLEQEDGIERVLVVCHGTVIRAFLSLIKGTPLDDFWKISQPNCSINRFLLKDGEFTCLQERILYYESEEMKNRGIL